MQADEKIELDKQEKEKFGIPQECEAYRFILEKIIEERCDEFDYELEELGFTIADRDMKNVATSIYTYNVVAYKD
ncbi:MAG: hypothetical protein KC478_14175 [Bacteriovoracaceae bacterium]|nr:hypothetical protein [Bacteriovoracaceae bacterium]